MTTDEPFRLSEDFESFVDDSTDPDPRCRSCGEPVSRDRLLDGECPGCRYDGDGPGGSATIATIDEDRDHELITDGGTDPRKAIQEHGPFWTTRTSCGNQSALHADRDCSNLGTDPDRITDPAEVPLRASMCTVCAPGSDVDYHDGTTEDYKDVPAIEDHDQELVTDGGQLSALSDLFESFFESLASSSKRTPPEKLPAGEYEAIRRDDGVIELYDGIDTFEPLMSVPEEDAERIAAALDEALGGED